jgi:hypothetical protein
MSSDPPKAAAVARAIHRAESHSAILVAGLAAAWRLAFTDERLEDALGCSAADIAELSLCLRPRLETWAADVDEIATAVGIDPLRLESFFRKAEVAERLAFSHPVDDGADGRLLAARDRDQNS